jgi:hypothetical protein
MQDRFKRRVRSYLGLGLSNGLTAPRASRGRSAPRSAASRHRHRRGGRRLKLTNLKSQIGGKTMRTAKDAAAIQETCSELLGFGPVSSHDHPARVKRSVSAKVGDKQPPPPGKAS